MAAVLLHPHRHPVGPPQPGHQGIVELAGLEPAVAPEPLGALLELREVVHVALDEVRDLLGGQPGVEPGDAALGDARGQGVGRLPGAAEGVVERHHRPGHLGAGGGHLPDLGGGEVVGLEDGVAEDLQQVGHRAGVVLGREGLEVQLQDLGQADEERRRERAPVVLDEVQVAGADAQPVGELGLGHALSAPHGPDLGAERGGGRHRNPFFFRRVASTGRWIDISLQYYMTSATAG
jgi:hypothetical protein